ncbi:amidohydrolase [Streptomyces sp. CB01635]|uniref:amidohydrolase n=1 Tax=unclassified Streptomyces TaxID=2593676 RepID=UPI000C27F629|nr:amidohydrolase [Streptomyces sp. CB01635]PJN11818.1 amidohydrolase [Streptomyces sp. CB01635]
METDGSLTVAAPREGDALRDGLDPRLPALGLLYRDLHSHPELSMQEHRTAGIVATELRGQGWEVTEGVGGTGVVGVLRNGEGPVVALRADMDGLPVREATGLDYASTDTALSPDGERVPLMHACGHDLHTAALLGATGRLAAHRELWRGTLLAIFQPGEETGAGARAMLADGLLERFPRPDVVLGQHVGPLPLGSVATRPGVVMAAADSLRARLLGRGGHGSAPHATVDPVVMAAATVMRLQGIVAREVSPTESAVVTVGSLRAGTKENIIPDEAELKINIRTFDAAVRERVLAAVRRTVEGEAATSGAPRPPEFSELNSFPLTVNSDGATERVLQALGAGGAQVHTLRSPLSGSEDFGLLATAAECPSVFWFFGGTEPSGWEGADPAGEQPPTVHGNHSPFFAPVADPALRNGVTHLLDAAAEWLDSV